jgi:hypothetical protein
MPVAASTAAENPPAEDEAQDPKLAAGRKKVASLGSAEEIARYLGEVSRTDPALALDLARTAARTDRERYDLASRFVHAWARTNAQEAWDWALVESAHFDLLQEKSLRAIVLEEAAATAPEKVIGLIDASLGPERRLSDFTTEQTTYTAVRALAEHGQAELARQGIAQWSRHQPEPRIGPRTYEAGARTLQKNFAEAAAWLQSLPRSHDRNVALGSIVASWAETDPETAVNWANELSNADGREEVRMRAFEPWMRHDASAASQWLLDHESDPEADRTIANLITSTLLRTEPTTSLKWAGLIMDRELRAEPIEQVLSVWAYSKPSDAIRYLQTCPLLSSSQKRRILRALEISEHAEEE